MLRRPGEKRAGVTTTNAVDFLVRRDDIRACRFVPATPPGDAALPAGSVLLQVDRFALTANNVTYAVFGERMSYWDFFPAPDGWGRVPVWGFGTVLRSASDAADPGERFYGYFPMSSAVVLYPGRVGPAGFADMAPHRATLHPLYNQYARSPDGRDARADALQMLLRPLFVTSFALDDFVADDGTFFGARNVVLSSASSKTAYGLAFLLSKRKRTDGARVDVVGLTSPRNVAFTRSLGVYDRVATYDEIGTLPVAGGATYVDFGGDMAIRRAVHEHFGAGLRCSTAVGFTHWEEEAPRGDPGLPGAKPAFFFAPERIKQRSRDLGPGGFERRLDAAWSAFMTAIREREGWLHVRFAHGPEAVERVYLDTVDGKVTPDAGNVLSLA